MLGGWSNQSLSHLPFNVPIVLEEDLLQRGVFNLNIFDRTLHEPANCHVDITTDGRPDTALASALQTRDSGDALKHRIWHRFTVCDLRSPQRLVQEHFHGLLGNDRTRTNDRHALTDAFDLGEYVAGQEQSCAVPGALLNYIEDHLLVERVQAGGRLIQYQQVRICLLYTSDAADEEDSVDLGGRRI